MLRSVAVSGIFGWVMVAAFVLALPSVADGAKQGANIFPWLMTAVCRERRESAVGGDRAGQLSLRPGLRDVDVAYDVRVRARRRAAGFARAQARVAKVEDAGGGHLDDGRAGVRFDAVRASLHHAHHRLRDLSYLSYVMPAAAGLRAYGRSWKRMGPFDLGGRLFEGWRPSRWRASCCWSGSACNRRTRRRSP